VPGVERVLAVARDPGLAPDQAAAELVEVLTSLEGAAGRDLAGRALRFQAETTLGLLELAEDPYWCELLEQVTDANVRSWAAWQLADAHLFGGKTAAAAEITRMALECVSPAPAFAPRLWHVRAEAARLAGRWDDAERALAGMEASLVGPEEVFGGAREVHELRARLLLSRGQIWLELGLLDRLPELSREALAEARASGAPRAEMAARLFALDQAFMRGDAVEAGTLAREGAEDARLAEAHARFRLAEGLAEVERTRDERARGGDGSAHAASARAALEAALAEGLDAVACLKALAAGCELALLSGERTQAREALAGLRAGLTAIGPERAPATETLRCAVLGWRLARTEDAPEAERAVARAQLFAAYRAFLAQWRSTPRRPGGIGFLHLAWRAQLVAAVLDAERDAAPGPAGIERAFERLLEAQLMGTGARERGIGPLDVAEVRRALLAPGRGMLVLLPARDEAHLFVLEGESLEHHRLGIGRDLLLERARRVTGALARPEGTVDSGALRRLHEALLPAEVRLRIAGWTTAVTVGFDGLGDLPFGILGAEDGAPYGERLALASLPSVAMGVVLARERRDAPPTGGADLALVLAPDPPPELGLEAFPFGPRERARWLAPFAGGTVAVFEGARASRGALVAAAGALRSARTVHFLTHGTRLERSEFPAALVLSRQAPQDERLLVAADVRALGLRGVVVLSACGSGRGPVRSGDDRLASLGGAFLEAGARCVVLARFPIEYGATLALMERFHARLAAGDPPSEALRAARAARGGSEALEAFHAGAFEVLGLGFERP